MTLPKCPDDELEKIIASEKAPLLARVAELEAFQITAEMNIGLNYCKTHRTIVLPFVEEFPCCVAAERDRLKEEVLQIGEQMAKRHEENKRLEADLEEARKAFKLLQERCKERE